MICSISKIKPKAVPRFNSGYPELNWIYGKSNTSKGIMWGIPFGKISLWAGAGGVGKSRAAISIAKKIVKLGGRILYFQNEVDLPTFSGWVKKGNYNFNNFLVSDSVDLETQIQDIKAAKVHIVFVDSINQLEEYRSGTKTDIKNIIEGYDGNIGFRQVSKETNSHIVFISQLNQDGSVKGSTTLSHLVDIEIKVKNIDIDNHFLIEVGDKHRYGRTGDMFRTLWKHTDSGVESVSDHRYRDKVWSDSKGVRTQIIIPEAIQKYWINMPEKEKQKRIKEMSVK
jgi:predicted ATP-dependent serine protease